MGNFEENQKDLLEEQQSTRPNFRIQNKISEILYTKDYSLLGEKVVVPSAEGERIIMQKMASGEIGEWDLERLLERILLPNHLATNFDPSERAFFKGLRNTPDVQGRLEQLLLTFVLKEAPKSEKDFLLGCQKLVDQYPTPMELEVSLKKQWQKQGIAEAEQEKRLVELRKPMLFLYGKRQHYWEQMKLMQKVAERKFPEAKQQRQLREAMTKIESIEDPEFLKTLLEASYSSAFMSLKKQGVPLNEATFFDPRFGEALRQESHLPALIQRLSKLPGTFDNSEIESIKKRALQAVLAGEFKVRKNNEDDVDHELSASQEVKAQVENFSFEEISLVEGRKIAERAIISGDEINGEFLTNAHLLEAGLQPKYKIKIGEANIFLSSSPYEISDSGRAVTAYVEKNGRLTVRTFYMSKSQGCWRYLPGHIYSSEYEKISWYSKGFDEGSVGLPIVMQKALAAISEQTETIKVPNSDLIFAGTSHRIMGETYHAEVNQFGDRLSGTFYPSMEQLTRNEKLPPERIRFTDVQQAPDFSKIITSWEQETNLYGRVNFEVFESRNHDLRFVFCRDSRGRAWVSHIENNSRIMSVGVRENWVDGGELVTPAFEYVEQAGGFGNRNLRAGKRNHYIDMFTNYLSKIPVIQEYLISVQGRQGKGPELELSGEKNLQQQITSAQNFEELYQVLRQSSGINGSKNFYNGPDLIAMIEAVRNHGADPRFITGAEGLRRRVLDLLKIEQLRDQVK